MVAADNRLFSIAGGRNERYLDSAGYLRTAGSAESELLLEAVLGASLGKSVTLPQSLGGVDVVSLHEVLVKPEIRCGKVRVPDKGFVGRVLD